MRKVEREQTILTTNRRNIRSLLHDLEMDKMVKTDKVVKASRQIIDKKVELVENEFLPTADEIRVLHSDFVRDEKFNPVQMSLRNLKKAERKY